MIPIETRVNRPLTHDLRDQPACYQPPQDYAPFPGGSKSAANMYPVSQLCPVACLPRRPRRLPSQPESSTITRQHLSVVSKKGQDNVHHVDPLITQAPVPNFPKDSFFPPEQPLDPTTFRMERSISAYNKYWKNASRPALFWKLHRISMYTYDALIKNPYVGPIQWDSQCPLLLELAQQQRRQRRHFASKDRVLTNDVFSQEVAIPPFNFSTFQFHQERTALDPTLLRKLVKDYTA